MATETQPAQQFLNDEHRLLDRYELQSELIDSLRKTRRHSHLVPRLAECHRSFRRCSCEHGHQWVEPQASCSIRLCPHCQRRRSTILAHRVEKFLIGRPNLRYIVFAQRSTASLAEGQQLLWASWTRLRRSVFWKSLVRGAIVALEVTYNAEEKTWHPHINVLFEGEFIPFDELNREWIEATRHEGRTSHIQAADAGTVRELMKYVTKTADLLEHPAAIDEFLEATARKRFVRSYGTFYDMPISEEEGAASCPDCDSTAVMRLETLWPWQVSLDFEGVLRPCVIFPPAPAAAARAAPI